MVEKAKYGIEHLGGKFRSLTNKFKDGGEDEQHWKKQADVQFEEMMYTAKNNSGVSKTRDLDVSTLMNLRSEFEKQLGGSLIHKNRYHVFTLRSYYEADSRATDWSAAAADPKQHKRGTTAPYSQNLLISAFEGIAIRDAEIAVRRLVAEIRRRLASPDNATAVLNADYGRLARENLYKPFSLTALTADDVRDLGAPMPSMQSMPSISASGETAKSNRMIGGGGGGGGTPSAAATSSSWEPQKSALAHALQGLMKQVEDMEALLEATVRGLGIKQRDRHEGEEKGGSSSADKYVEDATWFANRMRRLVRKIDELYVDGRLGQMRSRVRGLRDALERSKEKRAQEVREGKESRRASQKIALAGKNSYMLFGEFRSGLAVAYGYKLLRLGLQVLALSWARQAFYNEYVREVHGADSRDPPPLSRMLYLFLTFDALFQLLLVLPLVVVHLLYSGPISAFRVDRGLLRLMVQELATGSLWILAVGEVLAHYLKLKRFFDYKLQGGNTIEAYQELLTALCVAAALIPFRAVLSAVGLAS